MEEVPHVNGVGIRPHVELARSEVPLHPKPVQAGLFDGLTQNRRFGQFSIFNGPRRNLQPRLIEVGVISMPKHQKPTIPYDVGDNLLRSQHRRSVLPQIRPT